MSTAHAPRIPEVLNRAAAVKVVNVFCPFCCEFKSREIITTILPGATTGRQEAELRSAGLVLTGARLSFPFLADRN